MDVREVLSFTHGDPHQGHPAHPSQTGHVAITKVYTAYQTSQAFFHHLNIRDIHQRKASPAKTPLTSREDKLALDAGRPVYSALYDATKREPLSPPVTPELPAPSRPLYRRPRPPPAPTTPPPIDLEKWKTHSFTTVCVDDPMDPKGYYKLNYPLVLTKVPRRCSQSPEDTDSFRPMSRTPDMSSSFFEALPLGKLETPSGSSVEDQGQEEGELEEEEEEEEGEEEEEKEVEEELCALHTTWP